MSKKSHKALASATVMSLILTSTLTATVSAATGVERLSGSNRETTAIDVATKVFEKAETVVLVNGYKSADALSATPLAKAYNAPILSVGAVDEPTAALTKALKDLGAKKVVVVGGEGAVTKALAAKLAETYTVERIEGKDRYATNVNVAKKVMELKASKEAFVVNGSDASYADALSIASIAASKGAPIVFTNGKTVSEDAKALVKDLKVTAIGGTGVVSADVLAAVDATRVGGADRFETNLEVLKAYKDVIKLDNVFVAYGLNFADALVASAAAAKTDAPVVLADKTNTKFTKGATDYIEANKAAIKNVYLVGGTGVIADSVKSTIDGIVNPVVTEFKVESSTALNLRQIEVKFTKDVDKTTAENVTNYKINGAALTAGTDYAKVINNNTVRITLAAARTNLTNVTFEVSSIKDANDTVMDSYKVEKMSFSDTNAPSVVSVEAVGPKDIKVTFSEPVKNTSAGSFASTAASDFRVNNGTIGIVASSTVVDDTTNSVTIKLGSDLVEGENTIDINNGQTTNFQDYAGIALPKQAVKFNYVKDTTAPVVSIKSASPNKVVLKFNKEVKNVNLATIYHGYSSNGSATINPVPSGQTYSDEWEVTFSNLLPASATTLYIKNASTSGNEIVDRYGNKLSDSNLTVSAKVDTIAPKVESIAVKSQNKLEIKFTEDVNSTDVYTKTNYQFLKEDGTILKTADFADVNSYGYPNSNVSFNYDSSKYVLTMTFTNGFKVGNYRLQVKNIKDTVTYQNNKMEEQVIPFTVVDKDAPKLSSTAYLNGSTIELAFTKDMATSGTGSVLDVNNYQIKWDNSSSPTSLPSGTTVELGTSPKIVRIKLGTTSGYAVGQTAISASVRDASGSQVDSFNNRAVVQNEGPIATADFGKIKLVDKTTVQFTIKRPVRMINAASVTIAGLQAQSVSYVNKVLSDGTYGAEVTAKVSSTTPLATKLNATGNITVEAVNGTNPAEQINILASGIETEMGTPNSSVVTYANLGTADSDKIADTAAPHIKLAQTADMDGDGMLDKITVTFSENVRTATVNDGTFTVDGYVVNSVVANSVNGSTFDLIISEKGITDTAATPKVKLAKDVEDLEGNATSYTANNSEVTSADLIAPVVESAVKVNDTTIKVYLSEAIAAANLDTTASYWTVVDSHGTPVNYAVSVVAINGKEVTLTVATIAAATGDVKVSYTTQTNKNEDIAGNDLASASNIVVRR